MSRHRRLFLRVVAALFAMALVGLFEMIPRDADARPGGGQTFGGSKSSGGSSSGGSRSSGSGSSGSRSSGGSSWGGSSRSSSSDSDSSWSKRPSYSSPWSEPTPPPKATPSQGRSPHGGSYLPPQRATRPSGSTLSFFFWIIVVVVTAVCALKVGAYLINRRLENWVEDGRRDDWESGIADHIPNLPSPEAGAADDWHHKSLRAALDELAAKDPDFSFVVFEDFMYALYTALHRARGEHTVDLFAPYLGEQAKSWLASREVDRVESIIVGAMRVDSVRADEASRRVTAELVFTANYTSRVGGVDTSWYAEEKWQVSRGADVLSRPPEKARVIGCPNCGAALDGAIAGKCKYCSEKVIDADRDWRVDAIEELALEPRGPMLTGTTEEVGTDAPTIVAPDARQSLRELMRRGGFTWADFADRVGLVFRTFHEAWSSQDLKPVRPFLSDALFDTQRYWVETYKAQGLRNVTGSPRITNIELSRVVSDAHYDAITVRVAAFCNDFTLDSAGNVVAGSNEDLRSYSEYWTLIRAAGAQRPSKADTACPNCGAPAEKLNMAGVCEACGSKITLGKFDWVLSRIEQDEVFSL